MKQMTSSRAFECCRVCAERSPGCHSRCRKYKTARKKHDELVERIKRDRLCVLGERNGHKSAGGFSS